MNFYIGMYLIISYGYMASLLIKGVKSIKDVAILLCDDDTDTIKTELFVVFAGFILWILSPVSIICHIIKNIDEGLSND